METSEELAGNSRQEIFNERPHVRGRLVAVEGLEDLHAMPENTLGRDGSGPLHEREVLALFCSPAAPNDVLHAVQRLTHQRSADPAVCLAFGYLQIWLLLSVQGM